MSGVKEKKHVYSWIRRSFWFICVLQICSGVVLIRTCAILCAELLTRHLGRRSQPPVEKVVVVVGLIFDSWIHRSGPPCLSVGLA